MKTHIPLNEQIEQLQQTLDDACQAWHEAVDKEPALNRQWTNNVPNR